MIAFFKALLQRQLIIFIFLRQAKPLSITTKGYNLFFVVTNPIVACKSLELQMFNKQGVVTILFNYLRFTSGAKIGTPPNMQKEMSLMSVNY